MPPLAECVLIAMRDSLAHRGPDDVGSMRAPGVALGCRRLAILDLSSNGHMPMSTPDGRYHIVYNGEIYNYRSLRAPLEDRGHRFRSNTDTEVLLYLYAQQGPAMLDLLNGMFAIAIWDTHRRELFLARDRLGVKPLFYAETGGKLYFASEQKALRAAGVPGTFDTATWEELLCFRFVAGERTPYAGVKRLLPGHFLLWRDGAQRQHRWWSLAARAAALRDEPPRDARGWFAATFDDSVSACRISDVPVGVLLSGGLDSGSVAASLALRAGAGAASFTVRFDEPAYDEGDVARALANRWELDHHEFWVSRSDLANGLRRASLFNDEPLAHGNELHILAISEYAKPFVTVLLSGEGSDEVLGGYVRYGILRAPSLVGLAGALLAPLGRVVPVSRRLEKLAWFASLRAPHRFVLFNACNVLPGDLEQIGFTPTWEFPYREQVLDEARQAYPGDLFRQAMYSDQHTFLCSLLDRNDRMTMGASIECRVPFLDYRLVERLASLPSAKLLSMFRSKHLLRTSLGERLPRRVQR
ncbi:MAG: asparagine synthase (glutamine-hydrolyzing), partial [Gemmatimonadaceae bacterium]